jgi:hypothetical protein
MAIKPLGKHGKSSVKLIQFVQYDLKDEDATPN